MSQRLAYRAFAKINLGLEILGRRPDGYHEVRTVLQSISLCDLLEIHPSGELALTCSDPSVPSGEDNLVLRAARVLQERFGCSLGARIALSKRIPAQAGLGGGSSDAATALLALSRLWRLPAEPADLMPLAAGLGSDVPYFLLGGTALGVGRGEEVYALPDAPKLHLVLAWPQAGMPTPEAYRRLSEKLTSPGGPNRIRPLVQALVEGRLSEKVLFNHFEEVNLEWSAESRQVRQALLASGASRAVLAGSGAAWVGLFADRALAVQAQRRMVQRGYDALATSSITRADYWEQTTPTRSKETLP